jgi:predicted Zn-dependent protease
MRPIRREPGGPAALLLALSLTLTPTLLACGTLSIPQERKLGDEMAEEVKREMTFFSDRVVVDYVRRLGGELVSAAGPQPFEYRFHVIEDDSINAFAMPAGYIYIHTETILKARNVSELAGVMAHEIGHVARRHIAENYNRARNTSIGQQVLVLGAGLLGGSAAAGAANIVTGIGAMAVLNKFGRDAETEADAFAVEVMPRAGYNPTGIVTFFETLRQEGGASPPAFLSSHPATADRIAATSSLIREGGLSTGLRSDDAGRLEIIQRRIRLLVRKPAKARG